MEFNIERLQLFIAWGLTTLVSAFIGSYMAGYLKKKGENLATQEDIDKLVQPLWFCLFVRGSPGLDFDRNRQGASEALRAKRQEGIPLYSELLHVHMIAAGCHVLREREAGLAGTKQFQRSAKNALPLGLEGRARRTDQRSCEIVLLR